METRRAKQKLEATTVGAFSSAAADLAFWSGVPGMCSQLGRSTKMRIASSLLLVGFLLCGCRSRSNLDSGNFDDFLQRADRSQKESGDFGTFFIQQVSHFGGRAVWSGSPPALRGAWYSESDHNGFAAQLYGVPFAEVEVFMEAVFGPPLDLSTNADTPPHGLYGVRQIDVAIQYFGNTNGVGFICVQKLKR